MTVPDLVKILSARDRHSVETGLCAVSGGWHVILSGPGYTHDWLIGRDAISVIRLNIDATPTTTEVTPTGG